VTPHLPDPQRGGGWGTEYEFLRLAARRHDITLLTGGLEPGATTPALADLDVEIIGVSWRMRPLPRNRVALLWRLLTTKGMIDFWRKDDCVEQLSAAVRRAEVAQPFDLVQVMLGEMAPVLDAVRAPAALFLFDVYSRWVEGEIRHARSPRHRWMWRLEASKIRRWEHSWYPRADAVACVSPVDAQPLQEFVSAPVAVIPIPIGPEFFETPTVERSAHRVTLVSMLDYRPNIDAVEWFASEIWPLVSSEVPTAQLHVVGRSPVSEVRAAVRAAGGTLHADVPDARPFYWEAAVAVVPLRLGSGMRNKVLHGMACGAPMVATSAALEGIGCVPGEHLLVGDDAAEFAAAMVATLRQPGAAAARAAQARSFVGRYRAEAVGETLDGWWRRSSG